MAKNKVDGPPKIGTMVLWLMGVIAGVIGLFLLFDPLARTRWWIFLTGSGFAGWLVVVGILFSVWVALKMLVDTDNWEKAKDEWKRQGRFRNTNKGEAPVRPKTPILLFAFGALMVIAAWPVSVAQSFNADVALRDTVELVSAEESDLPELKQRAPFLVAERQAVSNLSGTVGDVLETKYVVDDDRFSTLVARRGWAGPGYETMVDQTLDLTGNAKGRQCVVEPKAKKRMGGLFMNSLEREIASADFKLRTQDSDTWAFCDEEGYAQVVVPVTKVKNFFAPVHVPAGVYLYSGKTGEGQYQPNVAQGELPGAVIPVSYSERVNKSLETLGGTFWTSRIVNSTGITDEVKASEDTNIGNHSNFLMAQKDSKEHGYVSPYTSRASSQTIDKVSILDTSQVKAGEAAKAKLYTLKTPRQSNAATADRVKADYNELGWETKIEIIEIVPGGNGIWHASVGTQQNVTNRITLNADGSSCLLTATGNKMRCSNDADGGLGAYDGEDVKLEGDISGLTTQQLIKLQEDVTREMAKRLKIEK